jgi:Lon protease-like protein
MELPQEVGIMTLPNAILFPQALLPLYIFEPRYRAMLKESLESQRMFAVALPHDSTAAHSSLVPHRVAGVGLIRACVDKPDGSSNLILQGVSRVRFTDFVQEKPYYVGRIEVLSTEESNALEVEALSVKVLEMIGAMHDSGDIQARLRRAGRHRDLQLHRRRREQAEDPRDAQPPHPPAKSHRRAAPPSLRPEARLIVAAAVYDRRGTIANSSLCPRRS